MTIAPDFAAHRARVLERLADDEAVLLFGGHHHLRNGDAEYRYRPDSDVYWLTGWPDPEVAVLLRKTAEPLVMFVQEKDKEREIWTGYRPGPEGAKAHYGADVAFTWGELAEQLPTLLQGISVLHYAFAQDAENDALVAASIRKAARAARKSGLSVPETFHAPTRLLHELRLFKTPDEVAMLRESARISALAHTRAMAEAEPGRFEYEIEAAIDHAFRSEGGTGAGYTSIVAGGANACVLHYVTNRERLRDGDLLLIDAGCEYGFYTTDVTRTFPVNGRFTAPQRRVYEIVLAAQLASIEEARVGRPYKAMHDAAVRVLTAGMVELGLLTGEVDHLIETEAFRKYYMHGTGHWLGLDVHDAGVYARKGESRPLEAGMVVTVEPGLYIAADDAEAPEELRGIGIRIEDDILVTEAGPDVLTWETPKSVADVEAACERRLAAK